MIAAQDPGAGEKLQTSIKVGAIAGGLYFLIAAFCFAMWVHYCFAGFYSGPLMISSKFGPSEAGRAAGAEPIYPDSNHGWDGQFYYTQSNDPLMLHEDYSKTSLFDQASYRYQRNGLPILARISSLLVGQKYTSPYVYLITQFAILSVGFGVLVAYLTYFGYRWWWALLWALYAGVLRPLLHGLPDPTADTMLLLSILAAVNQRLVLYSIFASILCLCRESYAAPAAVIWLMTITNWISWKNHTFATRFLLTAVPGAVVLSWAFYVADQTQTGLLGGSRTVPWGGLIDWPFVAFLSCLKHDISTRNNLETLAATATVACIVAVLVTVIKRLPVSRISLGIIPHLILMTMTGSIVWGDGTGFFKNASSVLLVGVLLVPLSKSQALRAILMVNFAIGLLYVYNADWRSQAFMPPLRFQLVGSTQSIPVTPTEGNIDYGSKIELISIKPLEGLPNYQGFFKWCHRDACLLEIKVLNQSQTTWPASAPGAHAISLGVQVIDHGHMSSEARIAIPQEVPPGGSVDLEFVACSSSITDASHFVRVSLVHDNHRWFCTGDDQQKLDIFKRF